MSFRNKSVPKNKTLKRVKLRDKNKKRFSTSLATGERGGGGPDDWRAIAADERRHRQGRGGRTVRRR